MNFVNQNNYNPLMMDMMNPMNQMGMKNNLDMMMNNNALPNKPYMNNLSGLNNFDYNYQIAKLSDYIMKMFTTNLIISKNENFPEKLKSILYSLEKKISISK